MPPNSNRTLVSTGLVVNSEHDIELADFQHEPAASSALSKVQQVVREVSQRMLMPWGYGFGSANALFFLMSTIMKGQPDLLPKVQKLLAEYQIPAVAGTYATLGALDAGGVDEVKVPNRIALSCMGGLGVTTFTLPMFMEILTRFIQLIEHEPRSSNVEIPDWSAALIITSCCMLGLIQAMQSDRLKTRVENPEQEEAWVTHPCMLTASAIVKSASSLHSVTLAFMEMAQFLHLSSLTPQSDLEYYLRWGITLTGGAVGGYILGRPGVEHRTDAQYFNYALSASQLFTLCLAFAANFYFSTTAEQTYGDVVQEQTLLWAAIIPVLLTLINLTQYLWEKSPALLNRFVEDFNNCLESFDVEPSEEAGEGLTFISGGLLPYYHSGVTDYTHSDSEDTSMEDDESSSSEGYSENSEEEQSELQQSLASSEQTEQYRSFSRYRWFNTKFESDSSEEYTSSEECTELSEYDSNEGLKIINGGIDYE